MREHAVLRRNIELDTNVIQHREQCVCSFYAIRGRIDADNGVARPKQQSVEDRRRDATRIVSRMIGLQPYRKPAWQADGAAKSRDYRAFRRHHDQILCAAYLCDRGGHLRRNARCKRCERLRRRFVREQKIPESADGQMRDRFEGRAIMPVEDQTRDLVAFVRYDRIVEECRQRQIGERELGCDPLLARVCGEACELVAAPQRRRFRHQRLQIAEGIPR